MKNIFKLLAVTALAGIAAASCTKESADVLKDGEQMEATFTAELPGNFGTKATIGDGTTVDELIFAVYDKDQNEITNLRQTVSIENKKATVKTTLIKGYQYSFIFWAQKKGNKYYNTDDLKSIKINYGEAVCNAEDMDAFVNAEKAIVFNDKNTNINVALRRPLAQINFGTQDYDQLTAQGKSVTNSEITISEVSSTFKPLEKATKKFADPVTATYKSATIPAGNIEINNESYRHIAMAYVLSGSYEDASIHDISAKFYYQDGKTYTAKVSNIPFKKNYKTNIYGNLLTTTNSFNVIVDESWDGNNDLDGAVGLLIAKIEAGAEVTLTEDLKLPANQKQITIVKGKTSTINLNGYKIITSNTAADASVFSVRGKLTINGDGEITNNGGGKTANVIQVEDGGQLIVNGGSYSVTGKGNACIYVLNDGKVTINGGKFESKEPDDNGTYFVLNQHDDISSASKMCFDVKGGTFINFDPAKTGTEPSGTSDNFVASGYQSTKVADNPTTYVVTKEGVTPVISQEGLNAAITGATKGSPVTIQLPANAIYTLDSGIAHEGDKSRNITFIGDGTQTVDIITKTISAEGGMLNYQRGSSFTFKDLKIKAGEGSFDGVVCDELIYEDCTISGKLTLYGKATFKNCTFNNTMADQYSIWTWGGTDVNFDGCTFNTNGKAILLYGRATAANPTNLKVENSIFNDAKNGAAGKAVIEIGNDYNATYSLVVNKCTVNGFAEGKNTNSKIWANKNSMDAAHLSVTIDGKKVQ